MNVNEAGPPKRRDIRLAMLAVLALASGTADAKDTKGLWFFGGALGYHTTFDSVPVNADLPGDPRPDDYASREITLGDGLSYALSAGFGLTDHLTLQVDAGYYRSDVGDVDVYLTDGYPVALNMLDPINVNAFRYRTASTPIPAGTLAQWPVSLTGTYRFRKDRPLTPYVGAGIGMIFIDLDTSDEVMALNERLSALRIRAVADEHGRDIMPPAYQPLQGIGRVPMEHPVGLEVDDAIEWHLTAGMEYFLGDRMSFVVDARYMYTSQKIVIDLGGQDQVDYTIWSEKLFRPDGSVRLFRNNGGFPNPYVDPSDPSKGIVTCAVKTTGDFDNDGHRDDLCYSAILGDPQGTFLVQGGSIDLSGFSVHLGMRFYF